MRRPGQLALVVSPKLNASDLSVGKMDGLRISSRSLERDLRHLRDADLVEFVGSQQVGFYRLKQNDPAT